MINILKGWTEQYSGSYAGFLVLENVTNPIHNHSLEKEKGKLETELRQRFASYDRKKLEEIPQVQAYTAFYKRFNKSYHVRLQLESIVFKEKTIPTGSGLVEAMFMAELNNLLLTAGHDLDLVQPPVEVGVAEGSERLVQFNGQEQVLKLGDMLMKDQKGILSSMIYGPARQYSIGPETRRVFYAVYAPVGISINFLRKHLEDIRRYVMLFAPDAATTLLDVFS